MKQWLSFWTQKSHQYSTDCPLTYTLQKFPRCRDDIQGKLWPGLCWICLSSYLCIVGWVNWPHFISPSLPPRRFLAIWISEASMRLGSWFPNLWTANGPEVGWEKRENPLNLGSVQMSFLEQTKKGNVIAMSWQRTFNTAPNTRGQLSVLLYQKTH